MVTQVLVARLNWSTIRALLPVPLLLVTRPLLVTHLLVTHLLVTHLLVTLPTLLSRPLPNDSSTDGADMFRLANKRPLKDLQAPGMKLIPKD